MFSALCRCNSSFQVAEGNNAEVLLFYINGFGQEPYCCERSKTDCSLNAHSVYFISFLKFFLYFFQQKSDCLESLSGKTKNIQLFGNVTEQVKDESRSWVGKERKNCAMWTLSLFFSLLSHFQFMEEWTKKKVSEGCIQMDFCSSGQPKN